MRLLFYFALLSGFLLTACSSSKSTVQSDNLQNEQEKYDPNATDVDVNTGVDLTTYLRQIPGVSVRGDGPAARVQIRGNSSFGTISDPLYVVNGTILGTSYAQLYSTVDPSEIARVKVLKSASETAAYGMQGGNGVIEIKLKK